MVTARPLPPRVCDRPRRDARGQGRSLVRLRLGSRLRVAVADQRLLARVPATRTDLADTAGSPAARRTERLAARTLLRLLLADRLGPPAADTPIAVRRTGQPYLPQWPGIGISLSHDAGTVAAAIGVGVAVGVDVQSPVPAPPALLRRCCTPASRAALDRLPEAARGGEFAWIWTVQEACVKATGSGLAGAPWSIPVPYRRRAGRWADVCWVSLRGYSRLPVTVAWRDAVPGRRR
ncbi:4'-phosphopantetheinyl transferase family protein [Actinoplanes regularis]|uniref:4'-phosphopantetheinyl transferase n=1 Tax=Actinoplanes regularis TaxID=52697 RepID=A0A239HAL3_9ACTN|nr:4'-phosphopantetheinyl transferase superfamily protein [Actinoplanes regularis]GIE90970.1 hypothetical protein Are01nite_74500 [Actinoplanes regularis]SNS78449.1 4'-phosphopantetheinyl transferase [Actinoplanes regularis]